MGLASIYRLPFWLKILTIACNYEEIKFKYTSVNCLPVCQKGAVSCETTYKCHANNIKCSDWSLMGVGKLAEEGVAWMLRLAEVYTNPS